MEFGDISASDWGKGIGLSIVASVIGGASKLAIRKSWLIQEDGDQRYETDPMNDAIDGGPSPRPLTLDDSDSSQRDDGNLDDLPDADEQPRCPNWVPYMIRYSGMLGMSVLNPICCVLAMNYASPSILAPFSGLTLVWVILFSNPVVGELPSAPQVTAAGLIIVGEVIVAIFGDHTNDDDATIDDLRESYQNPWFVAYFILLSLYLTLLAYWITMSANPVLRRFAWGSCGGSVTGLQNFLKDSLTIVKATEHSNFPWFFPVFLFLAGVSAFGGLLMLTACMKRYDATYSAASFVGSFVISASIMSAVHYNTFAYLKNVWNFVLYPAGLIVLMIGVYILVRESRESGEADDIDDTRDPARKDSEDSQDPFMYSQVEDADVAESQVV